MTARGSENRKNLRVVISNLATHKLHLNYGHELNYTNESMQWEVETQILVMVGI